jgi:hypothetical protein
MRHKRTGLAGALLILTVLITGQGGGPEAAEDVLETALELEDRQVTRGDTFRLGILVRHPSPGEVSVEPSDFGGNFHIDSVRSSVRLVRDGNGDMERRTLVEVMLTADAAGRLEIPPFRVSAGEGGTGRSALTAPLAMDVRRPDGESGVRLEWAGADGNRAPPAEARTGEAVEAALRVADWGEAGASLGGDIQVRVEVPENAIAETLPLADAEREAGIVLRLRVVPLDGRAVRIAAQAEVRGGLRAEVPVLTIGALPPADEADGLTDPDTGVPDTGVPTDTDADTSVPDVKPVSFSKLASSERLFPMFAPAYEACVGEAAGLWERERYAEALALLRRGERFLAAASALRRAREACEAALGLPPAPPEPWLPLSILSAALGLGALAAFVLPAVLLRRRGRVRVPFAAACLAAACLAAALCVPRFPALDGGRRAVTKRCAAYPIPEAGAAASASFYEGEPVRVLLRSAGWLYAESALPWQPPKSGWIKEEDAAHY